MGVQYRVIVARRQARVQLLTGTKAILEDVVLMPLGKAVYYQQRKPFDVKATLMSPYGIMGSALPPPVATPERAWSGSLSGRQHASPSRA